MSKQEGTFNLTGLPEVKTPNKGSGTNKAKGRSSGTNKAELPEGLRLDEYQFGESTLRSPDKLSPVQVRKYFGDAARERFNQR
jgi:hypothetical protein